MLPCPYTTGRPSRLASSGVATSGRDAITYGTSRPCIVRPMKPTWIFAPRCSSESRQAMTSVYSDVSVYLVRSARVCCACRTGANSGAAIAAIITTAARRLLALISVPHAMDGSYRFPGGRIETLPFPRHLDQQRARVEPPGVLGVQLLQPAHDLPRADRVDETERPAAERRKADAEHRADVAVARRADDVLLEAARPLVDHRERAAALDLLTRQFRAARAGRKQGVHRLVPSALPAARVVEV